MARCKCDSNGLYVDSDRIFARDISISYWKYRLKDKQNDLCVHAATIITVRCCAMHCCICVNKNPDILWAFVHFVVRSMGAIGVESLFHFYYHHHISLSFSFPLPVHWLTYKNANGILWQRFDSSFYIFQATSVISHWAQFLPQPRQKNTFSKFNILTAVAVCGSNYFLHFQIFLL